MKTTKPLKLTAKAPEKMVGPKKKMSHFPTIAGALWIIFSNVTSQGFQTTLDIPCGLGMEMPGNDLTDRQDRTVARNDRFNEFLTFCQKPPKQLANAKRPKDSSGIIKLKNTKIYWLQILKDLPDKNCAWSVFLVTSYL